MRLFFEKCHSVSCFLGGLLDKRSLMKCKEAETLQTDCLLRFQGPASSLHYNLEVQAKPKKKAKKRPMLFVAFMVDTGLSHDIYFRFSIGPFEVE